MKRVTIKGAIEAPVKHEPKFYEFHQNNSGGSFVIDKVGISICVIIEAMSAGDANDRAEDIGIYFDADADCRCCGSRWYGVDSGDTVDIETYDGHYASDWVKDGTPFAYIHYLDGSIVGLTA
jgi:hypothetical protein